MPSLHPVVSVCSLLLLASCVEGDLVDETPPASTSRVEVKEFALQTGPVRTLGVPCWEGVLHDQDVAADGWQTSCEVTLLARPGRPERALHACGAGADLHAPCWRNRLDLACELTPTGLTLEVAQVGPGDHGTLARAQCELE